MRLSQSLCLPLTFTLITALSLLAVACSKPLPPAPPTADPDTEVAIRAGKLIGFKDAADTYAWLGIPYASAPVGELRWRAPRPETPWQGIRQALQFADYCPQIAGLGINAPEALHGSVSGSEDCLYLNVWAPEAAFEQTPAPAEKRPVMVWIHGGGNTVGTANTYPFANHLAGNQDVVVVTLNYRLGVLGWFRHPALLNTQSSLDNTEQNPQLLRADQSGNFATLDIIQALHWVQNNIAAFGGDPNNVTIFGESAGGFNVYSMLLSPLAKGLYHKAISQSGGIKFDRVSAGENYRDEAAAGTNYSGKEIALALALKGGKAVDRTAAKEWIEGQDDTALAVWLRGQSVEHIFSVFGTNERPMGMVPAPYLFQDGYVLPAEDPQTILNTPALFNPVPFIAGSNRDEMKLFMMRDPQYSYQLLGLIPRLRDKTEYELMARYQSDMWRILAADQAASAINAVAGRPRVYTYRYDFDQLKDNWLISLSEMLGAAHGLEISYAFGLSGSASELFDVNREDTLAAREKLAYAMSSYWANFAYTGTPGRGRKNDLPLWQAWDNRPDAPKTFLLDADNKGGLRHINTALTVSSLKEQLQNDPRLINNQALRCKIYTQVFKTFIFGGSFFDEAEYAKFGQGGCPAPAEG